MNWSDAQYRAGWDEWQPDVEGTMLFELEDLVIHASVESGFAYDLLQCGGTLSNGKPFRDMVRAAFCLIKSGSDWKIVHQHMSKPMGG
ncbi:Ketosteroid isomerase-like enzyme (fragment) [Thiomonas sp. X19]|uniref:nuclear transport factor 2 family protein n=1 Tax=Thiomonas sp. X19 TaxID=1050370 RepID=UPI000B6F597A